MSKEVVFDFERVTVSDVMAYRDAINNNKGVEALSKIKKAIVSVEGKPLVIENLRSRDAINILATVAKFLRQIAEDVDTSGVVIDLDGWYIRDQDAYYQAVTENEYKDLDRLFPMVVKSGPGVNNAGVWVRSTADLSYEDFVKLNKAINKEISDSFSEGN